MNRAPVASVTLVAGGRLPLGFIGAGLVAFGLAAATLAWTPGLLLLPHVHPHVVALTHLWLPGFLLSICIGALYQLMPVVLGTPLRFTSTGAWIHFGVHVTGVTLLIGGFATGRFSIVAAGGTLVAGGVSLLLAATWRTFWFSSRRDAVAWSFPLAVTWLAATVFSGVIFALNRRTPFVPASFIALLQVHAHLGLAGFFLTLLQGATFQLVPMFTMADLKRPRWIASGLVLGQIGLVALTAGLGFAHLSVLLGGALVLATGVAATGVALLSTLRSRRRRKLEPGLKGFVGGALLAGFATLLGITLVFTRDLAPPVLKSIYGVVVIGGALTGMLLGMVCKIVPFLVWMRAYGPRAGRQPVPLATALGSRALEHAWLVSHASALSVIATALWFGSGTLAALGTFLLAVACAAFLGSMTRALGHLWYLQTPSPSVAAPSAVR